jgi:hypothetical protein
MKLLDILIVNAITFYLPPKDEQLNPRATTTKDVSMDDAAKILQTKTLDERIDAKLPETKMVFIEKPEISEITKEFKKQLIKTLPIDEPPPRIVTPIEIENPRTGEIKIIDAPPSNPIADDTPVRIEVPTNPQVGTGGGGGGGSAVERDFGTGMGRERVFDNDMERRENIR